MRVLYFDPIVGVSGDMILASLIDLGVSKNYLKRQLKFVPGFDINVSRVVRQGISARNIRFRIKRKIREKDFLPLINRSKLSKNVKCQAAKIINRIFEVEKKVHQTDHLHLHELADVDTLLDIAGALVAIEFLKVEKVYSKPVKTGSGFIKTVEGNMPAFNFATAELLKGFPVQFLPIPAELTTPTGAAILSTIAIPANDLMFSKIDNIGIGAGAMDFKDYPNLLRVFLGETDNKLYDTCVAIETNIDDMNPQDYEILFDSLYDAGALEVFLTPVIMKRSRPGIVLTVLCDTDYKKVIDMLFNQTTSIGLRINDVRRIKLKRQIVKIPSPYGDIRVKIIEHNDEKRFSLEYQDLKRIAQKNKLSIRELRAELTDMVKKKIFK